MMVATVTNFAPRRLERPRLASSESAAFTRECYDLIDRIMASDQDALVRLYDLTNRRLFGLALRILDDPEAAEEVVLDVYLQVWQQADRFDALRGGPLAWLFTITRSRAIDALRRSRKAARRFEPIERVTHRPDGGAIPDESAADAELRAAVVAALDALPREQRAVIELAYFGGLSHTEIADALAIPLGTVKTRTRLALNHLRGSLAGLQHFL